MASALGRQSLPVRHAWARTGAVAVLLLALTFGGGCRSKARKGRPVNVIYINRRTPLGPQEEQALSLARAEVGKWDTGLTVTDHRVQPHLNGWTVSLLLSTGLTETGEPLFPEQPIRNVEINRALEVVGYHVSQ
jgi:hypothetical protein